MNFEIKKRIKGRIKKIKIVVFFDNKKPLNITFRGLILIFKD